jgi:hypothetical protein
MHSQPQQTDRYLHNASSFSRASFQQLKPFGIFIYFLFISPFFCPLKNQRPFDPDKTMVNILLPIIFSYISLR